jgi:outer membrane protein OmpA-like peptidoglycan-associated protein
MNAASHNPAGPPSNTYASASTGSSPPASRGPTERRPNEAKGPAWVWLLAAACVLLPAVMVFMWISDARDSLAQDLPGAAPKVAVASAADENYCTPELKKILRRVLQSCGLAGSAGGRGCQPLDAKNVATMSGSDFNALFRPMAKRGGIVQFDLDSSMLDEADQQLVDKVFADQQGASYFFVVSRASPEGSVTHNRELSKQRAEAVLAHLRQKFNDPDLDKEVGLLWLGEEFAQLENEFCSWQRSGAEPECNAEKLNRSAFVAWIDCRL